MWGFGYWSDARAPRKLGEPQAPKPEPRSSNPESPEPRTPQRKTQPLHGEQVIDAKLAIRYRAVILVTLFLYCALNGEQVIDAKLAILQNKVNDLTKQLESKVP